MKRISLEAVHLTLAGTDISQKHTGRDTQKCPCSLVCDWRKQVGSRPGRATELTLRANESESIIVIYTKMAMQRESIELAQTYFAKAEQWMLYLISPSQQIYFLYLSNL